MTESDNPTPKPAPSAAPGKKPKLGIEDFIVALCAEKGPAKTIDPMDAAKAFAASRGSDDDMAWRTYLGPVRQAAIGLARRGRLVIYRKGKPVDPNDFRGVIRLGVPRDE